MNNVMLDLETWGKRAGCAIRSIGAVLFDPYSNSLGSKFYVNVTRESCEDFGLHVDPDTEAWWSQQSRQAQDALAVDPVDIDIALEQFAMWFMRSRGVFVWSQGANFDQPIIEEAMRVTEVFVPWKFWDSRCTRTAYDMGRFNPRSIKRVGTHHNALEDAEHQARCVQAAYRNLRTEDLAT